MTLSWRVRIAPAIDFGLVVVLLLSVIRPGLTGISREPFTQPPDLTFDLLLPIALMPGGALLVGWLVYQAVAGLSGQTVGEWLVGVELERRSARTGFLRSRSVLRLVTRWVEPFLTVLVPAERLDALLGLRAYSTSTAWERRGQGLIARLPWLFLAALSVASWWNPPANLVRLEAQMANAEYDCCIAPSSYRPEVCAAALEPVVDVARHDLQAWYWARECPAIAPRIQPTPPTESPW